eukprot:TRINITY_DN13459_c1_g1_i1.p1 TRINITY_DN13459_c1_g1~~TRINITY_DN13459_c1_g1_i1.p1  ORF type:complete len:110 (-),score=6.30 TRINITY_DN13459_c1_g1_i1:588-917(-)
MNSIWTYSLETISPTKLLDFSSSKLPISVFRLHCCNIWETNYSNSSQQNRHRDAFIFSVGKVGSISKSKIICDTRVSTHKEKHFSISRLKIGQAEIFQNLQFCQRALPQ